MAVTVATTADPTTSHRQRFGLWALAGVEAEAFILTPQCRRAHWPVFRRACVRAEMWVTLLCCERRVNESGTSLCMMNPRSARAWLGALGRLAVLALIFMVVSVGFGVVWWPLFWAPAAAVLMFVLPSARSGWENRRAKAVLKSFGPCRPAVFVHSVARVQRPEEKGAGAMVMRALVAEADERGWLMALDAGAPALVAYYERFGFERLGEAQVTSWGSVVRMTREPAVDHG